MSHSDTKHRATAGDDDAATVSVPLVELHRDNVVLPIDFMDGAPDAKDEKTAATAASALPYQELSLHLNAPDKHGVAFQLGGLIALHECGLMDHIRFIHSGGFSNFIVAHILLAIYAKAGYPDAGTMFKRIDGWMPLTGSHFKMHVVDPIVKHLLRVDHESTVMRRRMCRPWKWSESWNAGFAEWYRDDWPHAVHLGAAMTFVSVNRNINKTVPIFTMSAADALGETALSTDQTPPVQGNASVDVPGNVTLFTPATDAADPQLFLMASVLGGTYDNAALSSALPMDPLMLYPYETYFINQRGAQHPMLNNDRCVVLDAFSRSNADQRGGVMQKSYTELQTIKLTESAVLPTTRNKPNDGDRPCTDMVPALYRHGYIRMHARDEPPLEALKAAQNTTVSMSALDESTMRQLINWGYVVTMRQLDTPVARSDRLPYPFHNHSTFGVPDASGSAAAEAPAAAEDL